MVSSDGQNALNGRSKSCIPSYSVTIGKFWRETFVLFTHPDGEAAKLPDAEVRSTNASSKKLNGAKKILSFFKL